MRVTVPNADPIQEQASNGKGKTRLQGAPSPQSHPSGRQGLSRRAQQALEGDGRLRPPRLALRHVAPSQAQARLPGAVDHPHQRRRTDARHQLLQARRRPQAANIELDRKILADLAISDPAAFQKIVEQAKK